MNLCQPSLSPLLAAAPVALVEQKPVEITSPEPGVILVDFLIIYLSPYNDFIVFAQRGCQKRAWQNGFGSYLLGK